jgi:hypothetical protein
MPVEVKKVSRETLYIAIATTATILVWIGMEIFSALTKSAQVAVDKQTLRPLPERLDEPELNLVKQRWQIEDTAELTVTESGKSVSIEATPSGRL